MCGPLGGTTTFGALLRPTISFLLAWAVLTSSGGQSAAQGRAPQLSQAAADSFVVPEPVGFVNDFAHVLTPADSTALLRLIMEVRAKCRAELAVVTVPALHGTSAAEAARRIGNTWGVGPNVPPNDPAYQAGVVLLLAPTDREYRLELADGARFISDSEAARLLDEHMRPALEREEYGRALRQTIQAVAQRFAAQFRFELSADAR
jgi:uncharacterized protein